MAERMFLPVHATYLALERCPYCSVHKPNLERQHLFETEVAREGWLWGVYVCQGCGYLLVAGGPKNENGGAPAVVVIPQPSEIDRAVPEPARRYLQQAREALHTPDGSTMLAASAVDALLKAKGYVKGSLNDRINQAAANHVITEDMAAWAHHVRLEANDPRHADAAKPHATEKEAKQTLEFALALAQFLFVLPTRVARGVKAAGGTPRDEGGSFKHGK